MDPRDQRLHAATSHFVYGPATHYSDDLGKTWTQAKQVPLLSRASKSGRPASTVEEAFRTEGGESIQEQPEKMIKVWNIKPGRESEPNVLYAGAQPASLFISKDRGETWELNEPLYDHPQRGQWNPGAGGLTLHTILLDPTNPQRMYIAVSAAGCYRTDDGGQTWLPINRGLHSQYELPDPDADVGHCVHSVAMHPSRPDVLFMQKHWDVMRSDDAGASWHEVSGNLPTDFGFPIDVHAHEPETIYVVPIKSDTEHFPPEGKLRVYRSRTGGHEWEALTKGLPQSDCYVNVLRDAMAVDSLDKCGIYFGTTGGQVYASPDGGDTWSAIVRDLP
ncbi:MAG TPA: exo-alpha-sialidase, partial [Nitrospiraceae bacterium]|nr:exo-alpha-sialidase [Nitrospiraceae bacterium]